MGMELRIAIESIVTAGIGLWVGNLVRNHPERLISVLLGSALLVGGLVVGPGYALLDEFLLLVIAAVLLGSGMVWRTLSRMSDMRKHLYRPLAWAPLILMTYMFMSSTFSAVWELNWRLLRWSSLYGALILVYIVFSAQSKVIYDMRLLAARLCLMWFGMWSMHWAVLEVIFQVHWETMQAITWSGSTYAALPAVVALPMALLLLRHDKTIDHPLALWLLFSVGLCAQLYSSRILSLCMLITICISVAYLPRRRWLSLIYVTLGAQLVGCWLTHYVHVLPTSVTIAAAIEEAFRQTYDFVVALPFALFESAQLVNNPRPSDGDRHAHIACAFHLITSEGGVRLVLGFGQDIHKQVMLNCPELQPYITPGQAIVRSIAFSAFVINHGLIGILLLLITVCAALLQLFRDHTRLVTVPFYLLCLAWALITDYRDHLLIWLVIVFNLLWWLSRDISDLKTGSVIIPAAPREIKC